MTALRCFVVVVVFVSWLWVLLQFFSSSSIVFLMTGTD